MDFFELNQHIEEKKIREIKRQIQEIWDEAEKRLIEEGFWGNMAQNVGNAAKRIFWGPQASDGTRPMANWTFGQRLQNAVQPPENRTTSDQAAQQLQQQAADPNAQQQQQQPQPGLPPNLQQGQGGDDNIFQDLRARLPDIGRAIATIQDPNAKNALNQQYQALFDLLHKTQAQLRQQTAQAAQADVGGGI